MMNEGKTQPRKRSELIKPIPYEELADPSRGGCAAHLVFPTIPVLAELDSSLSVGSTRATRYSIGHSHCDITAMPALLVISRLYIRLALICSVCLTRWFADNVLFV